MPTITGLTAARMLAIEAASVISGVISGNNLILTKHDGSTINAGNVRGPAGPTGPAGGMTSSPAGGDLSGNYPNPTIADAVVTDAKVASANVNGAASTPSMRSLGTSATQASAGNHTHTAITDSGWTNFTAVAGEAPFGSAMGTVVRAQYRKIGQIVHLRIQKASGSAIDHSGSAGNWANSDVMGAGSVPAAVRPDATVQGAARMADSTTTLAMLTSGAIVWTGGQPRLYAAGVTMIADFFYMLGS